MFFMIQKGRIHAFMNGFRTSKISWLYEELRYFGIKFTNTFGKVLQTQILISFINCLFSMVMLWIMRFPSILALGVMIFLLGIVPVAGVFISLVPLSIIAYSVGGWNYILYVLIMIAILHVLESYVLNPKLMSDKTNLPIFFTFLILTISGHFFGIWGMFVGIPVFVFLLDILDVKTPNIKLPLPTTAEIKAKLKSSTSRADNDKKA
jgi:predicted PurR-regulated permease PerM